MLGKIKGLASVRMTVLHHMLDGIDIVHTSRYLGGV